MINKKLLLILPLLFNAKTTCLNAMQNKHLDDDSLQVMAFVAVLESDNPDVLREIAPILELFKSRIAEFTLTKLLGTAIENERIHTLEFLIDQFNARMSPAILTFIICRAAQCKRIEIIDFFVAKLGRRINNKLFDFALQDEVHCGNCVGVQCLITEFGNRFSLRTLSMQFYDALRLRHLVVARELAAYLTKQFEPNSVKWLLRSRLNDAALAGDQETLQWLIEHFEDYIDNADIETANHFAANTGHQAAANYLQSVFDKRLNEYFCTIL